MLSFVVRRVLRGVVTMAVTLCVVFVLVRVLPSDPALALLRDDATPEQLAQIRKLWGLDQPIYVQFWTYLSNLARGDAGDSYRYQTVKGAGGVSAFGLVAGRFPATMQLAAMSVVLAVLVSIPLGIVTALKPGSLLDNTVFVSLMALGSLPSFWIGLELIVLFGLVLGLLPTSGIGTPQHIILPAITLSISFTVMLTRLTRTEMARVMRSDYVVTAYAKGLSSRMVMWRHALRNAAIPLIAITGLRLGTLLHGSIVTETVFAWPGIGSLMVQSIAARDYPVIQVVVPISALVFVMSNLVVDLMYAWADPRLRMMDT